MCTKHLHLDVHNGKEFFSLDNRDNLVIIQKLCSDPNLAAEFGKLFEGVEKALVLLICVERKQYP